MIDKIEITTGIYRVVVGDGVIDTKKEKSVSTIVIAKKLNEIIEKLNEKETNT